ncbi:DNA excision repair protein ERCC-5 homolog isoform X1 [Stomoxys calcitrans]|uniref:DNA excision repair protein ERCC-5 homolog isoform X1 n=1 Tax=Stomoxys calcitrans TaxID=35570 RepID=UPI0027E2406C|nr:DNA excision repair protein ERCC-5 homolog isoform X1 [Stomoxys calcitrans]
MGVTGLWKLIEPCGKPVPVETLEGKVLAIGKLMSQICRYGFTNLQIPIQFILSDVSIWLHQVVKGFQDNKGAALNNAHLLGLFHRLCKLMYYRVKPVFVFDGCVPQLKRDTIARRQQQRSKLSNEADRIQNLLLQSLAKEKVVMQALGPNAEQLLTSPIKKKASKEDSVDDMFKLPELPESSKKQGKVAGDSSMDDSWEDSFNSTDDYTNTTGSTDDSSYDESNPRHAYNTNILAIDVRSNEFKHLPADVRHDILVDIKETRKQSSWGRLHELPSRSDDFSVFQMKRLLKRRDVQVCLEEAEQEMGNDNALTFTELTNIFTEEGILESEKLQKATKQISSSENTRFLLVRDLKKKLKKVDEEQDPETKVEIKSENTESEDIKPSTSKGEEVTNPASDTKELGKEYDADLELALALSLEENTDHVYDDKDYEYDSDEVLKLNRDQRERLQDAAKGPARAYMIEYAGMNKDEVQGILERTQVNDNFDETLDLERLIGDGDVAPERNPETAELKPESIHNESQEIRLQVTDDSDSTDSDLEEVEEEAIKPAISITVDVTKATPADDDLFADVFKEDECVIEETPDLLEPITSQTKAIEETNPQESLVDMKPKMPVKFLKDLEEGDECFIPETPPVVMKSEIENPSEHKSDIKIKPIDQGKKVEILSILDELKQQVADIKKINLDEIKLSNSVIELSDDEVPPGEIVEKKEIIEICDSDDNQRPYTPPLQITAATEQTPKSGGSANKSPKFHTPSKNHAITEFFNVNYVVKRTPDKPSEENEEAPKVKSPFFVKKTPKSASKSGSNSPTSGKKVSKASKSLFDKNGEENATEIADEDGIEVIKETTEEDVIKEAAELLKSNKTTEELDHLAADLAKDRRDLENERNRQDRMSMSITQRMNSDCQELLRLFGVPYIIAPMEAEAQCAFLDIVELTNGTITDDSDIWLFGGRTVYKNFFAQNKHVLEFRAEQIEKDFNCDRQKLIQLACLVGSDYTTGIHGIGAVTAMEILASFAPKDIPNAVDGSTILKTQYILSTLQKFRTWWQSFKNSAAPPGTSARLALQKKLKNIEVHEGFPNVAVVEAYLTPKVDENKEPLSWGYPDVESLREFAKKTFGWTTNKTDDILMPVMKKLNEKRTQQSIRNYFNVKSALNLRQLKVSKRVQNAIDKMTGKVDSSDDASEKPTRPKRSRQTSKVAAKRKKEAEDGQQQTVNECNGDAVSLTIDADFSSGMARGPLKKPTKRPNIPNTKQVIPQREKTLEQMEANRKMAAEILKNSAKETKKKRKA